jgi:single-strand DNA-binding protein
MNVWMGMGRLSRDPETRFMPSGTPVCTFSLACNHRYKGKDGNPVEACDFIDCEAFARTAEIAQQYLVKGRQVIVEARLSQHKWTDNAGKSHSRVVATVNRLHLLANSKANQDAREPGQEE